jgi:hypothetical protein
MTGSRARFRSTQALTEGGSSERGMPAQGEKRTLLTRNGERGGERTLVTYNGIEGGEAGKGEVERWERRSSPRESVHVGDRVDALSFSDEPVSTFELDLEDGVESASLVLVSLDSLQEG